MEYMKKFMEAYNGMEWFEFRAILQQVPTVPMWLTGLKGCFVKVDYKTSTKGILYQWPLKFALVEIKHALLTSYLSSFVQSSPEKEQLINFLIFIYVNLKGITRF